MTFQPTRTSAVVPSTKKGRQTRQRLLRAARTVFDRAGYASARMTDIAEEAGLSLGALYRYFEDKDAVFLELISAFHEELFDASRSRGYKLNREPYLALLAANSGFLSNYQRNAGLMRALVEASAMDERYRDFWWALRNRFVERFIEAAGQSGLNSQIDEQVFRQTVEALCFMVEQWAYVWLAHGTVRTVDEGGLLLTNIWYSAINGLRNPAEGQHPHRIETRPHDDER
jgi:AcrR family transcriptional regulator